MVPRSFLRQDDPKVLTWFGGLFANTKMDCMVPRSFLRQDDPIVVNVVCRIVCQYKNGLHVSEILPASG